MNIPFPQPVGFGGWAALILVLIWGLIITFGPPVFLYLFWRGFVDVHRIANALDRRDPPPMQTQYERFPRKRARTEAEPAPSIVPSQFGR
jgi:hypothetical protein